MYEMWKLVLAAAIVLGLTGAAMGIVAAQTNGEGDPQQHKDEYTARLAENLGISQEELEDAILQTKLDLVDEAVADGRLTEEEAAQARERIESGEGFQRPPGEGRRQPGCQEAEIAQRVAEFLGIPQGEVTSGLAQGQTLAQIAEENGSSAEELAAFLLSSTQERVAQAVEDGKIDEARAEEILANAEERIDRLIHREGGATCQGQGEPNQPGCRGMNVVQQVAEFLGVPQGEVVSGLEQDKSLAQIAEENGSSAEELAAFLLNGIQQRVAQAVEDGKIDEARAEEILANAEEKVDRLINLEGAAPCQNNGRQHRPGPDGGPQEGSVQPQSTAPIF